MDVDRTTASQFHQSEILKQESITNNRGNLTTLHRRSNRCVIAAWHIRR